MITRNGICYDFRLSEYRHTVDGLTFVFSSRIHRDKFKERLTKNREQVNRSLTNRFNISVSVDSLADVVLYRKIEKRGFLILNDKGECLQSLPEICYAGGTVTTYN